MRYRFLNVLLVLILLALVVFSSMTPASAASDGITTPQEMETFLDSVIADRMNADHLPGVVVTVVKDGQVFFTKGYGYSNVAAQTPVDPSRTLFRIGSVSKLFVWTAVMQLVEQGKLDLNADINTYLDFQIPATYPEPITMKNLMTHTPGFEEYFIGGTVFRPEKMTSLGDHLKNYVPARVFPPGKIPAYSNYGVMLAGYIVERISGMPFYEYVEKNIFEPLGMNHSTFRQPLPADLAPDMAGGYRFIDGKYRQVKIDLIPGYPAGSIVATADDVARFMIAHLQNGIYGNSRILSDATAQQMHSLLKSYDPRFEGGMGYGFMRCLFNGQLAIWHWGDVLGFHTGLYLLPEQNLGFYISNNGEGDGDWTAEKVFKAFMDHYFPGQPSSATPPADMAARAALYTGEYYFSYSDFTGITKIINLFVLTKVSVDERGYLVAHLPLGLTARKYVEVEPGLLQGVEDPSRKAALNTDDNGQIYIYIDDFPYTLIKASWYQTPVFHLSVLLFSLLVFLVTLIGWFILFVKALIKRQGQPQPLLPRLARICAVAFIILLLGFLLGFFYLVFFNVNPDTGEPLFKFEEPTILPAVLALVPIIAVVGIVLLVFTALAWVKRFWTLGGKLHYTLITLTAWLMLWELAFWNFLKI